MRNAAQTALRDLDEWSQRLTKHVRQLQGSRTTQRAEALSALRQIEDPVAIPAMERLMSMRDERLASEAVGIISNIPHADAAESLVRHAVASPWPRVRSEATFQLDKRPLHEFVPVLFNGLQFPIRSVFQVTPGPAGQILHEHVLFREGADENLQLELTSLAVAAFDPVRDRQRSVLIQQRNVVNQAQQIEQGVASWNMIADQQNLRIYQVLQHTTHQVVDSTPTAWWDWWREYNEYEPPQSKPTRRWQNYLAYQYVPTPAGSECFPAGTLVWTESGRVATRSRSSKRLRRKWRPRQGPQPSVTRIRIVPSCPSRPKTGLTILRVIAAENPPTGAFAEPRAGVLTEMHGRNEIRGNLAQRGATFRSLSVAILPNPPKLRGSDCDLHDHS